MFTSFSHSLLFFLFSLQRMTQSAFTPASTHTLTRALTARTSNFFLLLFKGVPKSQQKKCFCCAKMLTQQIPNQCTFSVVCLNKLRGIWFILKGSSQQVYAFYCSNPCAMWNETRSQQLNSPVFAASF